METQLAEISFSCVRHPMTMGEHICGECGHLFCAECVVFPFGADKPPMCIACALERGGVRRQPTGRPKLARRSIKERLALQRQARQAAAEAPAAPAPTPQAEQDEDAWLEGRVQADDLPGGWRQEY